MRIQILRGGNIDDLANRVNTLLSSTRQKVTIQSITTVAIGTMTMGLRSETTIVLLIEDKK